MIASSLENHPTDDNIGIGCLGSGRQSFVVGAIDPIIHIEVVDVLSSSNLNPSVARISESPVAVVGDDLHPLILCSDLDRAIGTPVIDQEYFQGFVGLLLNAVEAPVDIFLPIVAGDYHGDEWSHISKDLKRSGSLTTRLRPGISGLVQAKRGRKSVCRRRALLRIRSASIGVRVEVK